VSEARTTLPRCVGTLASRAGRRVLEGSSSREPRRRTARRRKCSAGRRGAHALLGEGGLIPPPNAIVCWIDTFHPHFIASAWACGAVLQPWHFGRSVFLACALSSSPLVGQLLGSRRARRTPRHERWSRSRRHTGRGRDMGRRQSAERRGCGRRGLDDHDRPGASITVARGTSIVSAHPEGNRRKDRRHRREGIVVGERRERRARRASTSPAHVAITAQSGGVATYDRGSIVGTPFKIEKAESGERRTPSDRSRFEHRRPRTFTASVSRLRRERSAPIIATIRRPRAIEDSTFTTAGVAARRRAGPLT